MDKDIIKSTLGEYLIPLNLEKMLQQIQQFKLDMYVKKLNSITTIKLFIFAQLMQIKSYTDISLKLNHTEKLQQELDLESISTSQLSRKFRDVNPTLAQSVFKDVVQDITHQLGIRKTSEALGRLNLIDSSTISLCMTQYRWAEFRKTKSGIKLHLRLVYCDEGSYPDEVVLTPAKPADKTQMDALVVNDPNALNVFDRGYLDYKAFDVYSDKSIRFVTRLKSNADIHVIEEKSVDPNSTVLREAIVRLGNKYTYLMKHPLRLIELVDSEGNKVMILTNDFNLSVEEISEVYRKRWQIELFFKWMKQHLKVKGCYGKSKFAVYNQILIALITFCLTVLLQLKTKYQGRLLTIFKFVCLYWDKEFERFHQELFQIPIRSSAGRRKWNHERIFQETMQQYENGDIAHLDDLTFDPII